MSATLHFERGFSVVRDRFESAITSPDISNILTILSHVAKTYRETSEILVYINDGYFVIGKCFNDLVAHEEIIATEVRNCKLDIINLNANPERDIDLTTLP